VTEPFGLGGGAAGAKGRNAVLRKDGTRVELKGCDEIDVAAGDAIVIETPGGGGFGEKS
jgi:5-oxoprolinase (ATP-hydrolysing)